MKRPALYLLCAALFAGSAFAAGDAPPGAAIGAAAQLVQSHDAQDEHNAVAQPIAPAQAATVQPMQTPATPGMDKPSAQPASAPSSAASLLQVIFGLVVVLGLLAAALWALKRFGGMRIAGGAPLKIIGGVSVGNREKVLVLEVGEQWLVVGVAPGRVSMLTTLPRGEQRAGDAERPAPDFGAWLKQTLEKRNVK
jgi:flagellar protein FliO/FliZ